MDKKERANVMKITVALDEQKLPKKIEFQEQTMGNTPKDCKAILLSFFERQNKETLKLDLWTKDMQVDEMDRFFFFTLKSMADTYYKATSNAKLATDMQKFVQYFGEETKIVPKV